jgi:hypothetical protein
MYNKWSRHTLLPEPQLVPTDSLAILVIMSVLTIKTTVILYVLFTWSTISVSWTVIINIRVSSVIPKTSLGGIERKMSKLPITSFNEILSTSATIRTEITIWIIFLYIWKVKWDCIHDLFQDNIKIYLNHAYF